jgi:uncharacterized protein (TIGR00251 family)
MADGETHLRVRVSPRAAQPGIVGRHGDGWKVRVAAPAEGGRANAAVLRLLADALELPQRALRVRSGAAAREKVIAISGLDDAEAERRLQLAGSRP